MSEPKKRRVQQRDVSVPPVEAAALLTAVRLVTSERLPLCAPAHVVTAINAFLFSVDLWTLPDAARLGSARLVERVLAKVDADWSLNDKSKHRLYEHAMDRAAVMGCLPVVQRLYQHSPDLLRGNVAIYAALSGALPLLQWLKQQKPRLFHRPTIWAEHVAFDAAAERGDLETVQWLVGTFTDSAWSLAPAALGGDLELVKWLHENVDIGATERSRPDHLLNQLILELGRQFLDECFKGKQKVSEAVERSIRGQWTCTSTAAMDAAASKGHLHVLQWLSANRHEVCSTAAVNDAAAEGHLDVLAWLSRHFTEMFTTEAMDRAAKAGRLDVVQWLHKNRSEGCTRAMDWAAANGDLVMVKWLHENRSEGCSVGAMNNAATNKHLPMVQWLSANRTEGCTTAAMDGAARNGFLGMVQWLNDNRAEGCTTAAVDGAAGYGHLDMVQFLYANRTEGGTIEARRLAEQGEMRAVLNWFDEHNVDLPDPFE